LSQERGKILRNILDEKGQSHKFEGALYCELSKKKGSKKEGVILRELELYYLSEGGRWGHFGGGMNSFGETG